MTFLLALLVGCAEPEITTRTLTDEGVVCLTGDEAVVQFPGCLSSSCDTVVSSSCTVTLEGDTLQVHAEATIEHQGTACTDDCGAITARCDAPDGAANVSYAGETSTVAEAACIDGL
ncbi:MAG TPA: hypothetical protein PKA64_12630 [Myxococcota bacterium]|nr:hypothetical protein [Myxococcota bacterium]